MTKSHFLLCLLLLWASFSFAQLATGDDPLGRPYRPAIGMLKSDVAPGVPAKVAEQISLSFLNGLKNVGGVNPPFDVADKRNLSGAVERLRQGADKSELVATKYWDDIKGVQYLLRLDINSYQLLIDPDSIFDEKRKLKEVKQYKVASANLTARLVDVATSKVLFFNNFDVSGTTRDYSEYPTLSDSARAMTVLYKQVRAYATTMCNGPVAGAATITLISKEEKGRAEEVILNNAPMILQNRDEGFKVFAIKKTYKVGDQVFRDAEPVGTVRKDKNFQIGLRNFKVSKGEKRIAELFKAGTPLICTFGEFPAGPFFPSVARSSLALKDFKNSSSAPEGVLRIFQDGLIEIASGRPLMLDVVDRELYELIQKERELQQKIKSDATQAGISIGSDYYLNAELINYGKSQYISNRTVTETNAAQVKQEADNKAAAAKATESKEAKTQGNTVKSKSDKTAVEAPATTKREPVVEKTTKQVPDKWNFTSQAKINISLVSLKTGEIAFTNAYSLMGNAQIPYTKDLYSIKTGEESALRNLANAVYFNLWKDIHKNLTPNFNLLEVLESGKTGPAQVLVSGGSLSGFYEDMNVEVVQLMEENVDGQKMTRDVVIATLRITDIRPETSVCKVKSGDKALQDALGQKATLYCRKSQ